MIMKNQPDGWVMTIENHTAITLQPGIEGGYNTALPRQEHHSLLQAFGQRARKRGNDIAYVAHSV